MKYVRVMPEEDDPSSPIGRSWKSTFHVATREEAEAKMRAIGSTWTWLGACGDVRTVTAVVPAIRVHPMTGKKAFFNSMVAAYVGWVDERNDPTKSVVLGDGSPVDGEALLYADTVMHEEVSGRCAHVLKHTPLILRTCAGGGYSLGEGRCDGA